MYTDSPYPAVFKQGKKVRFVGTYPSHFLKAGEVYTVRLASEHTLFLEEVFGPIFQPQHFVLVEDEKPSHTTAQEKAIVGGLQPHSIGTAYPLGVVAYANGDTTLYTIENVAEGKVMVCVGVVTQFTEAAEAFGLLYDYLCLQDQQEVVSFVEGRPQFGECGTLALVKR